MKLLFFTITLIIFFIYSFFNLGNFLDVTQEPSKTDLVVCLGGGDYKTRIAKTVEIYNKDFSNTNTIILTSYANSPNEVNKGIIEDKRITYIKEKSIENINIIHNKDLRNTADEIKFIKKYMIENSLKNVTIVSDPAHSRRIMFFSKLISVENDKDLLFKVVGTDDIKWNKEEYYKHTYSFIYAFTEVAKTIYGIFIYGILEKLGLDKDFENYFEKEIKEGKVLIQKEIYSFGS